MKLDKRYLGHIYVSLQGFKHANNKDSKYFVL